MSETRLHLDYASAQPVMVWWNGHWLNTEDARPTFARTKIARGTHNHRSLHTTIHKLGECNGAVRKDSPTRVRTNVPKNYWFYL